MLGFVAPLAPLVGIFDLVALAVGALCLVLMLAGWMLAKWLGDILGHIPVIGGPLKSVLAGSIAGTMKTFASLLDPAIKVIAEATWSMMQNLWALFGQSLDTHRYINGKVNADRQANQNDLNNETLRARAAEQRLADSISQELLQQELTFAAELGQVEGDIAAAESRAEADARQLYQQALAADQANTGPSLAQVDQLIAQAVNPVEAQVQTLVQQEVGLNNQLNSDIAAVRDTVARGDASTLNAAELFATGAVAGAAPGIVAQALAQLQPQLNKIETDLGECLDPLCETVTPNAGQLGDLGKLLKALEDLFGVFALTGLLVAAVEDPKGTAGSVVEVMGWAPTLGLDLTDAIFGAAGVVF